jgi:hypothetical protein
MVCQLSKVRYEITYYYCIAVYLFLQLISVCFKYLGALIINIHVYNNGICLMTWLHYHFIVIIISFYSFKLTSIFTESNLATLFSLSFYFNGKAFLYPFTFNLFLSSKVKRVSFKAAYSWVLFFFFYTIHLYLFIEEFNPFTFKVIIHR